MVGLRFRPVAQASPWRSVLLFLLAIVESGLVSFGSDGGAYSLAYPKNSQPVTGPPARSAIAIAAATVPKWSQ